MDFDGEVIQLSSESPKHSTCIIEETDSSQTTVNKVNTSGESLLLLTV